MWYRSYPSILSLKFEIHSLQSAVVTYHFASVSDNSFLFEHLVDAQIAISSLPIGATCMGAVSSFGGASGPSSDVVSAAGAWTGSSLASKAAAVVSSTGFGK